MTSSMTVVGPAVDVDGVRRQLEEHLRMGRSQKKVADAIGRSPAALSLWLRGAYQGDLVDMATRVQTYLEQEAQRLQRPTAPPWVPTSIAQGVLAVLQQAELTGSLGVVLGAPGMGKTEAVREHVRRSKATIHVTVHPGLTSALPLVEELVDALRLPRPGRTLRVQMRAVLDCLKGTHRVVVVDEAQMLNPQALEMLRYLHDSAGIGLVLVGNMDVHPLMRREGAGQFAQLFSRIAHVHRVPGQVPLADVQLVVRGAYPHLADDAITCLHDVANGPLSSLRHMVRVLTLAATAAYADSRSCEVADIRRAAKAIEPTREVR